MSSIPCRGSHEASAFWDPAALALAPHWPWATRGRQLSDRPDLRFPSDLPGCVLP